MKAPLAGCLCMRWRGLEPPRPARGTRPSTLRVYQFRHQRAQGIVAVGEFDSVRNPRYRNANRRSTREPSMLSKRQQEIYDFVVSYAAKHGYPPTVREIGEEVGLASPSTVHAHLANLELECPRFRRVAADIPRPLQVRQVRVHGGR